MVMPSNNAGIYCGYLCGKYPDRLGWLISPGDWKAPPKWMPYALDNGAFSAWKNRKEWDEGAFWDLVERAQGTFDPLWVVVPDVVADASATLQKWEAWSPALRKHGIRWPLAFAVQDGMKPQHVPKDADIIFVGGSTEWKWKTLRSWTKSFKHVHVARVNSERLLWLAHEAGCESCDGTGWFRGDSEQLAGLERYLDLSSTQKQREPRQIILESIYD